MATSSGHFDKGGAGYFAHNDRTTPTNNSIFSDEKNEVSCSAKEAFSIYRKELAKRSEAYTKRTGQKLQKNAVTHRSLIINLQAHHKLDDLKEISNYIEKELDTKIIQVSIHRDEGHINEEGEAVKNYHAHIEMMGIDSLGFSIAQHQQKAIKNKDKDKVELKKIDFTKTRTARLDSKFYRNFQTFLARSLGMERGQKNSKAKRLGTYEYKEHAKKQAEATQELKLTVKELKKEFEKERKKMAAAGIYTAEDYAALAKLKKSIKKDTLADIAKEFDFLKDFLREQVKRCEILEKMKEPVEVVKEVEKIVEKIVENPVNAELEQENAELKALAYSNLIFPDTKQKVSYKDLVDVRNKQNSDLKAQNQTQSNEIEKRDRYIAELKKSLKNANTRIKSFEKENAELREAVKELKRQLREQSSMKERQTMRKELNTKQRGLSKREPYEEINSMITRGELNKAKEYIQEHNIDVEEYLRGTNFDDELKGMLRDILRDTNTEEDDISMQNNSRRRMR